MDKLATERTKHIAFGPDLTRRIKEFQHRHQIDSFTEAVRFAMSEYLDSPAASKANYRSAKAKAKARS